MNQQHQYLYDILQIWYAQAKRRGDQLAMKSYDRKMCKLILTAFAGKSLPMIKE